jgi:hypothetical protein
MIRYRAGYVNTKQQPVFPERSHVSCREGAGKRGQRIIARVIMPVTKALAGECALTGNRR